LQFVTYGRRNSILEYRIRGSSRFNRDGDTGRRGRSQDIDAEFVNLFEASNDRFKRRRVNIVSANLNHLVGTTHDTTLKPYKSTPASARLFVNRNDVAGSIANNRARVPGKVCYDQLARLALRHGIQRLQIDNFREIKLFEQVQAAGLGKALDGRGTDLRHAPMINDACAPCLLDFPPNGANISTGFARDNQHSHGRIGQIDSGFGRHFRESKRVGGRTKHHGRRIVDEVSKSCGTAHAASGQTAVAGTQARFECGPKTKERAERKWKEQPILAA
jgi:hypothetical protein